MLFTHALNVWHYGPHIIIIEHCLECLHIKKAANIFHNMQTNFSRFFLVIYTSAIECHMS